MTAASHKRPATDSSDPRPATGRRGRRAAGWSSRSLGSRLQHAIFYALLGLGGRRAAYPLLFWVVLWYMFKPSATRRSAAYLRRRFPAAGGLARWRHRWRLHWELGKTLVDRAASSLSGRFFLEVSAEERARLRSLHAEGKGLILLASHAGCWHMALSALPDLFSGPANVVMYRAEGDHDRHYFELQGLRSPFGVIDPSDGPQSAVAMIQCLQRGEVLCLMGDRPFGDAGVCRVPFLGADISVPYTAYYLAAVSGAPIVMFFTCRTGPDSGRAECAGIVRIPSGLGKRPEAYLPFARAYAAALETYVAQRPYQFFNFYNMWETDEHQRQAESRAD